MIRSHFGVKVMKTSFECDQGDIVRYNCEIWCEKVVAASLSTSCCV